MKVLLLLLLTACATHVEKSEESMKVTMKDYLNPSEKKIFSCLENSKDSQAKKNCLAGTSFASSLERKPSSSKMELINQNKWFFESESKKLDFLKMVKAIKKIRKKIVNEAGHMLDERGVGLSTEALVGTGFAGAGVAWYAEFVIHHEKFGVFCAPGLAVGSDTGVTAGLEIVRSLSCPTNQAYEGGFLSVGAGVSGETLGLPFEVEVAYSLGVDVRRFLDQYWYNVKKKTFDPKMLMLEMSVLPTIGAAKILAETKNGKAEAALLNLGLRMINELAKDNRSDINLKSKAAEAAIKSAVDQHKSIGSWIKNSNTTSSVISLLQKNGLPHMALFFKMLTTSLTGCDSVGGAAALSLSASPVSVGLSFTKYSLLFETPVDTINSLAELSPLALMDDDLLDEKDLVVIIQTAKDLLAVPVKAMNSCGARNFLKF